MARPSPLRVFAALSLLFAATSPYAEGAGLLVPRDGSPPIQLQSHRVTVTIDDGLARTTVRQTFINPHGRPLEAIYVFPVPEQAALVDLSMEAGGQRLEGLLAERRAARRVYDAIVSRGKDPALLEQIGRSKFRLSVFPVLPDEETMVELTWIEVVPLTAGEYRYVYPLALAGAGTSTERDLTFDVTVRSSAPIASIKSPAETMESTLVSPHHARASLEHSRGTLDQDLVVSATVSAKEPSLGARVFRNPSGDAFFAAVLTPPDLTLDRALPRDVTLALDVPGSMKGQKIEQAKSAAIRMISDLRSVDRANVILFSSTLRAREDAPVPMTDQNRAAMLAWIRGARATGGTALGDAVEALSGVPIVRGRPAIGVVLTDGIPTVGRTRPGEIIGSARAAGDLGLRIWTFGVGNDVDGALLDGVAAATGAQSQIFRHSEEIEPRLRAFSIRTASPAISNLAVNVGGKNLDSALPHPLPVVYLGEQVIITGRIHGSGEKDVRLTGILENREFILTTTIDLGPSELQEPFGDSVARDLFARAQLDFLARAHRLRLGLSDEAFFASLDRGNYSTTDELVQAQIDVSLETGVQSPFTSFIALLPEDRRRLDPRDVSALDQALLRVTEVRRELANLSGEDDASSQGEDHSTDLGGVVEDEMVVTEEEVARGDFTVTRDQPLSDTPFEGKGLNDVLGVGGGAGGRGGGKYGGRGSGKGGGRASQKAVEWRHAWISTHQGLDGSWSKEAVQAACVSVHPATKPCPDSRDARHDIAVTSMTIVSYLGSGNTVSTGKYKLVVRRGLKYLTDIQDPDTGRFGMALGTGAGDASLYDHAVASVAMTEGYGLSKWPFLKPKAQRSIDFLAAAILDEDAWASTAGSDTHLDLWTAAWATMAIASARDFGLAFPEEVIAALGRRIDDATANQTEPGRGVSRASAHAAVSLLFRTLLLKNKSAESAEGRAAEATLLANLPSRDAAPMGVDFHYECFGSYAMYQMGGTSWDSWQAAMLESIVKTQVPEGPMKGTWDPAVDPWGASGGRVYASAINALSLEVYYRYDRIVGSR